MDWSTSNGADFLISSASGLISSFTAGGGATNVSGTGTVRFGIVNDDNSFFGFVEALRRNDLLKVLAEPTLITVSGRPAFFNSGGEFPILVPQSLGTSSIEFKKFGTQVDFVPIVLGNGNIRLEVRPKVSELDDSRGISINGVIVPALKERVVDTAVEMKPGQTLALAGLVQTKLESVNQGLPWLSDLPYLGIPFRRVNEEINEVELLIIVTPEVVDAVDGSELPICRPGMHSEPACDHDFYLKGYLEVPAHGPCAPGMPCGPGGVNGYPGGLIQQEFGPQGLPPGARIIEEVPPGSTSRMPAQSGSMTRGPSINTLSSATNARPASSANRRPALTGSPSSAKNAKKSPQAGAFSWLGKKPTPAKPSTAAKTTAANRSQTTSRSAAARSNDASAQTSQYDPPIPPSPQDLRTGAPAFRAASGPGFIGPVGYDVTSR
jgi:pilus assembly protein CpaC